MNVFEQVAVKVIAVQEVIIGPLALECAAQVQGLTIDWSIKQATIEGDATMVIEKLLEAYSELFGDVSIEVSKDAVAGLVRELSPDQVPAVLRD